MSSRKIYSLDFRFFFAYAYYMTDEGHQGNAERPEVLAGRTIRVRSPFGTVFVTLNEKNISSPFEVFLKAGKCGSDVAADAEAIGRLCTLLLSIPSPISELKRLEYIIENLSQIGGSKCFEIEGTGIRSVPDALAFALKQYLRESKSNTEF